MILASPGDVAFTVFGFPVYYYGIILASACLLAVCTARFLYDKVYNDGLGELIWDVSPFVIILGILGARLYYCFVNFGDYIHNPLGIFMIREGGLSIHGGIIAGILGLYLASLKYKISFLKLLDIYSVGTILAQSFGRWGNFFNNEAFGLPSNGVVKLYIPLSSRPEGFEQYEYFHPAFLYESVLDFILFLLLVFIIRKIDVKYQGVTFCTYLALYSVIRFFVEGIRLDSAMNIGDFHIAQIVSAGIFLFACIMAFILVFRVKKLCN